MIFKAIQKNGVTLALFACATTGVVAITQYLTADRIQAQQEAQLKATLNQVIPLSAHDNDLTQSCTLARDPRLGTDQAMPAYIATLNGQASAIAIESIAPDGYSGPIKLITGVDLNGQVLATRVLQHNETPGLGDKIDIRISNWIRSFTGKTVTDANRDHWKVRKDGGDFDQFTGATITPRAVVKAVRNTVDYVNQHQEQLIAQIHQCEE